MAAKSTKKKKVLRPLPVSKEKEPEYMVQVNDPKALRKDALESLREVIIFMQGHEKFLKIQEEKVAMFTQLKSDVKELNSLVDNKLRKYLPKGKIRPLREERRVSGLEEERSPLEVVTIKPTPKPVPSARPLPSAAPFPSPLPPRRGHSELEELESQLKDIEDQLREIQ